MTNAANMFPLLEHTVLMNLLAVAAFGLGRAYKGLQAFAQQ